ncbi:S8 family serine peptidase [Umezawaea endophytica]|uniref:S8 family serine peptidase n=1 Tax=Umezawaea endophytica TaxID=1654476 RepID=A0A9X2VVD5_9PSEU|nr:S8 family serine peptidase [Umezawaea endophytica]MCS7482754.1 S8 family serine peptidase [Umezawaea endophytica]
MRRTRRRGARWSASLLALGLVVGSAQSASAAPGPVDRAGPGSAGSVTLITGDQVVVIGDQVGSIVPGRDRAGIPFSKFTAAGHQYVVPEDAKPLLAAGKLDQRLFDVTGLLAARYDDAHRDSVPLIVTPAPGGSVAGLAKTADLPVVGSFAARAAKATAADSWRALAAAPDGYRKIWLDGLRQPTLDRSTAQIGAPDAWRAGYTGTGVKVAVLDTGVDAAHPDLVGRELAEKNFTQDPDNQDLVGHGTHVAATIASAGAKYRGVAPDSQILDGKVCVNGGCAESWILDGMAWAAEQGADVVNLSLGGDDSPEVDPLEAAVNALSAQYGTLFVIAAGNSGRPGTVGSPGSADAALTVGAVDREDRVAPFSSRGPRVGDGAVKPDITAPGVDIVAAKSSTGSIGTPVGDSHVALSGTSMATPHVAGAAALLKQQHPDWTGARLKAALVAAAKPTPGVGAYDQGAGRVDLTRAITQSVTAEPVSVALGVQEWPHEDDEPVTKDITYRNTGPTPVALDVAVDATGPDGKPAGLFTVAPAKVTVPAGGEAKVSVTGDTKLVALDGGYAGSVVASSGATSVRTPVAVLREGETHTLTLDYTDADGAPATQNSTFLVGLDSGQAFFLSEEDGQASLKLPVGNYFAGSSVLTGDDRYASLPYPRLNLTANTTVAVDARLAKPITLTVPDPKAEAIGSMINLSLRHGETGVTTIGLFLGAFDGVTIAQLGPDVGADLSATLGAEWRAAPVGTTPVTYRYTSGFTGSLPTGYVRSPAKRDFAEVRTRFGPTPDGRQNLHGMMGVDGNGSGGAWLVEVPAPGTAIGYLAGENIRWRSTFVQTRRTGTGLDFEATLSGTARAYRPGGAYRETMNTAVFGPTTTSYSALHRRGDTLTVSVPLFGDGVGNPGGSMTTTARTTLFRDGVRVGESPGAAYGEFEVPAAAGSYRVEAEATRSVVSDVSTKVSAAWTFRSAHEGDEERKLPLSVLRFQPELDAVNAAPAGRLLRVPLVVRQNAGADNGKVRRIAVEASFDDGATWRRVPVVGDSALVLNGKAGFASLRAKATDSKGNTAETTVIRAYKITGK